MKYRATSAGGQAPLSPQVFQILVSLLSSPLHGYAIIQDIRTRTNEEIRLTASTLYDALGRLVSQRWIEEVADADAPKTGGATRRCYRLTTQGRKATEQEAQRLERLLATVKGTPLLSHKR